ncbi:hypothetical protein FIBSPDRAFT_381881 [Athelia psychrophila]|uniref:DUF7918 domain-containing protein n=1 Tax=Athelia psychrophila TaxID=1759441 RepID=A0A167VAJ0_9AGAM|nr:hypothetical protein FIBSPDRAFT_381881 [Fibularhizoctonia sp. CBS 109695]
MPMTLPGFGAWIECDGSGLACHAVECSDDGKTATCWIASEVGKTFSVCWSREYLDTMQEMGGRVYIDGVQCGLVQRMEADEPSTRVCHIHGISTSSSAIRPFIFANLQFTDDNEYTETGNARRMGDIELEIYHVEILRTIPATWTDDNPLGEPKIHERAKKATSHKVKLGDEIMAQNSTEQYTAKLREKLANFTFKYRPIDVLRANDIILDTETDVGSNFATNLEAADYPGSPSQIDGSTVAPLTVKEEASEEGARAPTMALQELHIKTEANAQDLAVKEEAPEEGARVAAGASQDLPIRIKANAQDTDGTQSVKGQDEEDADVAELRALKEKSQKLERKIEMKALRKRLADLEREDNGDASTSQGPTKKARTDATEPIAGVWSDGRPSTSQVPTTRVKKRSSVMDLTGDSD